MKKFFATALMLIVSVIASAQSISQKNINNEQYLVISMTSETEGYNNVQALFNAKDADTFNKRIAKFTAAAEKMAQKAREEGKKNFNKAIPGTVENTNLQFCFDGADNRSEGYFMVPSLDVDAEGNCYLLLRGYYKGYNITSSKASIAANDKVRYQEKCEYNYNMRIPVDNLDHYNTELSYAVSNLTSESLYACK